MLKTNKIGCSYWEQPIACPVVSTIILAQQKFIDMKKIFLMAAILAVSGAMVDASAKTVENVIIDCDGNSWLHKPPRSPKANKMPIASYNPSSTVLNVSFPFNGQGGKVEIYRNGTLVVDVKAPAGAKLSYVLSNYGSGNYIVVVSSGKTVIYYGSYIVK